MGHEACALAWFVCSIIKVMFTVWTDSTRTAEAPNGNQESIQLQCLCVAVCFQTRTTNAHVTSTRKFLEAIKASSLHQRLAASASANASAHTHRHRHTPIHTHTHTHIKKQNQKSHKTSYPVLKRRRTLYRETEAFGGNRISHPKAH